MSELFREIEEDIKRERFEKLWQKFGRLSVYTSIGIVMATAGFVVWENYSQGAAEKKTARLLQAVENVDKKEYKTAIPIFSELANDDSSAYYPLVMLQKAQSQEQSGDAAGAKQTYIALAKRKSELAELAKLKAADKNAIIEVSKTSPFYHSLEEYNAWQLLAAGKKSEAADIFASLAKDDNTPNSLSMRANEVLRVIAPEKSEQKKVEHE